MVGAVQLGVLAACVVLFLPMGMAGWHLSRNKVLFFSGALFIALAVAVHLTPYFPAVSSLLFSLSSLSSVVVIDNPRSCLSFLHDVSWPTSPSPNPPWSWASSAPDIACHFRKLLPSDASLLLNGSTIVVAGDSQSRLFALSLLTLLLSDPSQIDSARADLFKRHSDYRISIPEHGILLDFIWAPYTANLTLLLERFKQSAQSPDVLVMGSGLWHMLHFTNASDYGASLRSLRQSVESILPVVANVETNEPAAGSVSFQFPYTFWLGMPTLINSMLNTEEKRQRMNLTTCEAYDRELYDSKLLRQFGGPLFLLDIELLSQRCGIRCTIDGMHYGDVVFDAATHIMLNVLLIESQRQI